jgi:hypothetical protein
VRRKFITYKCLFIHPFLLIFSPSTGSCFSSFQPFSKAYVMCTLTHYCRLISNGCVYISNEYENEVNESRISKNSRWCCKSEIHRYFHSAVPRQLKNRTSKHNNLNVQLRIKTFENVFAYVFLYSVSCDIPSNHVDFPVMHEGR